MNTCAGPIALHALAMRASRDSAWSDKGHVVYAACAWQYGAPVSASFTFHLAVQDAVHME